ncbi:hypothetical protein CLHOM_27230 [Clostridium homopropionicum DSM 5847]|uniref:Uncharacterized protein n=1 Tax=Clostridium homopropionicum DSM 5847 TaxID=1121318 RepID=A0A0L6Z851_9CLOT|nr:NusG domain II-containing protein [Clostridium homopropionicum]KOA18983.1 hypothetical protein CLHOM_27230 [Clostridium homopropionicum DSM 5847]SFG42680.1 hypothetical protein SAMN04488501_10930 [Clostridium homopropionicum]
MKKLDKIIVAFFVIIAIVLGIIFKFAFNKDYNNKYVEIYVKGQFYKKVSIKDNNFKEEIDIKTDLGENIVQIENGGVRIVDADCPDKVCIKDGFKDKVGSVLVCLPHKVVIQIKGQSTENEVDEVSQ